ncbi:MAG: hypothetical protein IKI24_06155 [Clostridia bacterium]|nr:hypothetical protein [Clostridia bacterium]
MYRKLLSLLLAALMCLSSGALADIGSAVSGDIGRSDMTPEQIREFAASLPGDVPLTGEFSLLGEWFDVSAEELDLDAAEGALTGEDVKCLVSFMPSLKKLTLKAHTELTNEDMIPIVDAHPEITFVWTLRLQTYELPTDLTAFSTKVGEVRTSTLTSEDCQLLRYAPNLRALDLGHHHIGDLSFLEYLPELRILILVDNNVRDITPIGSLEHLQYLELFVNPISDISPLANCTELLDLNLSYLWFHTLKPLEACTKLERFWCVYTSLSYTEKQNFKKAHPGCDCLFLSEGSSTYGTWRKHPRYFQYREMFDTGVWKEFTD